MTKIIILFSLGYILVAGITAGIYAGVCGNEDPNDAYEAFTTGIFWPISIPILIIVSIVAVIAVPIECLIEHITSSNTTSKKVQKTTDGKYMYTEWSDGKYAVEVWSTPSGKRKAYKFVNVGNPDDEEHSPPLDKCGEQYVPN